MTPISITHIFNGDLTAADKVNAAKLDTQLANLANAINTEAAARQLVGDDAGNLQQSIVKVANLAREVQVSLSGLQWLPDVLVASASTINVPLTGLVAGFTIDGVTAATLAASPLKRVLLWQQTVSAQNGIYNYADNGVTYTLTMSTTDIITVSSAISCVSGVSLAGSSWKAPNNSINQWIRILQSGATSTAPSGGMNSGAIYDYAGPVCPTDSLECDGTDYAEAAYPALVAAIGHTWDTYRGQAFPGAGRFRVPKFDRQVRATKGGTGTAVLGNALADFGGEEAHTPILAEMFAHTHAPTIDVVANHDHGGVSGAANPVLGTVVKSVSLTTNTFAVLAFGGVAVTSVARPTQDMAHTHPITAGGGHAHTASNASMGSSTPFNVIQPTAVVMTCIKK